MAIWAVGYELLGVKGGVVDDVGAQVRCGPRADGSGESDQNGSETEDNSGDKFAARIVPVNEGPHDVDVVDGIKLEGDPEVNQVKKRAVTKFEIRGFHRNGRTIIRIIRREEMAFFTAPLKMAGKEQRRQREQRKLRR